MRARLNFDAVRKRLHTETVGLLAAFDALGGPPKVIIQYCLPIGGTCPISNAFMPS